MGVLAQLGLLLKKNVILRLRQPGILVLEVVWPILIVAVVALIRQGVPLRERDTCHYQERAMPSAGVTPFLQTFVCNLDNQCHSSITLQNARDTTTRVSRLVQNLAPTISSEDVLEGLEAMDKGVEMLDALQQMANQTEALDGLDAMLKVKSFFKDPNYVKAVLTQQFKVMDENQVDAMMEATVNITLIFELLGYPDFRGVVCDPVRLGQFLLFKPTVDVRDVSRSLCNISSNQIPSITEYLQSQFDIAQLIRIMGKFEKVKERLGKAYSRDMAFNDIADMVDLALKSPTLIKQVLSLSSLKKLPDLIRSLQYYKTLKDLDMTPFVRLVDIIDPVVEEFRPNDTVWYVVKYGVLTAAKVTNIVQGKGNQTVEIAEMFQTAQKMGGALEEVLGMMGESLQVALGALTQVDWSSLYAQLNNNSMDFQSTANSLQNLQQMLQQDPALWNVVAPVVMVTSRFLEMGNIVLEETKGLEQELLSLVNQDGPTQTALATLFNNGPDVTLAVLSAFTDSRALAKLFESPFSYGAFCNSILNDVQNMSNVVIPQDLRTAMCNNDVATTVQNLMTSLRGPQIQNIINMTVANLQEIANGVIPTAEGNFTLFFIRARDLIDTATKFMNVNNATWQALVSRFSLPNIDLSQRQWEPVLDQLNENYVATGILAMTRAVGIAMENGNVSPMISQYVHQISVIAKYMYDMVNWYTDLFATSSPLSQMVRMITTYSPYLVQGMSIMGQDIQKIQAIVSMPNPMAAVCTMFSEMQLQPVVPREELNRLVCQELPKVVTDLSRNQVITEELIRKMSEPLTGSYSVGKDWSMTLDYTEQIVEMMQKPETLDAVVNGATNVLMQVNLTQVGVAFAVMGDLMANFSTQDVSSFGELMVGVMAQLDSALQTDPTWRNIKLVTNAANVYMELMLQYSGGTDSVAAILSSQPPMVRDLVTKMAVVTPDIISAVTNILRNPDQFVTRLMSSPTEMQAPDCSRHFVSDYLMVGANSPVREFEKYACTVNWTALYVQENDPYMQAWEAQVIMLSNPDWSLLPTPMVNWTLVMKNLQRMTTLFNPQMSEQFSFAPFNVSAIDMKWTEFLQVTQSLQNIDMNKLGALMTNIQMSLERLGLDQMGGTNTTGETERLLLSSMYGQIYIQHHVMTFLNKVLADVNAMGTVNLLDYLGSQELKNAMRVTEISPQLSGILLNSLVSYLMDPAKINPLIQMGTLGTDLCTNLTLFTTVFDVSGSTSDPATIQSTVCSSAFLNYTVMYQQLRDNLDGFAKFADAIERISTDSVPLEEMRSINVSVLISDQTTFQNLLNQSIWNPPTVVLTANNDWMNMTIYANQWKSFLQRLDNVLANYQDPGFMMMWQKSVTTVLSSAYVSIPGFEEVLQYLDIFLDMGTQQLKQSLESLPEAFKSYPNLSKMLSLVEKVPEAFLVVAYTNMIAPQKVMKWTEAMASWQTFCSSDSKTLFETPAGLTFNMGDYLGVMCSINITALGMEAAQYDGTQRLNQLIQSPELMPPVNMTAIAVKMTTLIETLTSLSTTPVNTGGDMHVFNVSVWMNVFKQLEMAANSTSMMSLENLQTTLTQTVFSSLQGVPGFSMVFSYLDVILDIFQEQVQRSLVSLPEAFREYPNMNALLELLNDLPSLVETVVYTNFNTPRKLSLWGSAMQSFEQFCGADPDTLMTVPPSLNFDLKATLNKLCSINFTALAQEAERYQGSDRLMALIMSNETVPVNATAVMAKLTSLINTFTQNTSSLVMPDYQPAAFSEAVWMGVFNRIAGYMNQSTGLDSITASIFGTAQDLFGAYGMQVGPLETVMAVVETILDRILQLENATTFAPRDIFPDAPQLQHLMEIVEQPGVLPVLLESLNSQKMTRLFMMNVTQVFMTLCMPGADITPYLSIPAGITVDISQLQQDFCTLNVTLLEPEVMAAFDVARINRVANGSEHVNWLQIGDKFQRVVTLMTRWTERPPMVILPLNWNNESFWLDMLNTYNAGRMSAESINQEIQNVLTRMGPLLMQEPFRQYGIIMETVLKLLNENMVALQNQTMTVTSMFEVIPVLRDVITALGLNADALETLITAPVKNSELFTRALVNPASSSYICSNEDLWNQMLVLPPSFDASALTQAVCNENTSAVVANLVRNLDLEKAIRDVANMSVMPNWENIFAKSQELSQHIDELIRNPPTFKVNESLALLEKAYNQSNLWNMILGYNVLAQAFGNSTEFSSINSIMHGSMVIVNFLNDIFQKMSVNGVTLDLRSLFQGSPTFLRLADSLLNLQPDPVSALASIQLKPSMSMAFSQLASDPAQLGAVFCSETEFRKYFDVPSTFDYSNLPTLCTLNFTAMANELDSNFMVTAMISKLNQQGQPFDLEAYVKANMQLNEKIMQLVGVHNVTFGDINLEQAFKVNTTALMEVFRQQSLALERDYPGAISAALGLVFMNLENVTEFREVALITKMFDLYLKYLNNNLKEISGQPLSLGVLMKNTELGSFLIPLLTDPTWLSQLLDLQIRTDKLQEVLQASSVTQGGVCSNALWDAFVSPTNETGALQYLQERICSLNESVLAWQSIAVNAKGYQFYLQVQALTEQLVKGVSTVSLNATELNNDLQETVQLVTSFINSLINSSISADNFFNVAGFQSIMNNLQNTLNQRLRTLSLELSTSLSNLIWPNIPDQNAAQNMARVINTINIFMTTINNKLENFKDGNVTLESLTGYNSQLLSLLEVYINVTKYGLQAWMDGQIHMDRIIQLLGDQSMMTSQCMAGTVAAYISSGSNASQVAHDLQTVLCTYSQLPDELASLIDFTRITAEINALNNATGTITPDFAIYTREIQRFSELLTTLAQSKLKVSQQALNMLDFSGLVQSLNNLAKDPSVIFQLLKPLGPLLQSQLGDQMSALTSILDTSFVLPLTGYLQVLQDHGMSLQSMLRDPSSILRAVEISTSFNIQMDVIVKSFVHNLFKSLVKEGDFISQYLCNETMGQNYIGYFYTSEVRTVFCTQPPTMWIKELRELGFGNVQLYSLAMKVQTVYGVYDYNRQCPPQSCGDYFCEYSCFAQINIGKMYGDVTWVQLLSDIEKLTGMFMQGETGQMNRTAMAALGKMDDLWTSLKGAGVELLESAFGTMAILDSTISSPEWARFRQIVQFVATVNNYFNNALEKFTNSSSVIYLTDIFPDPTQVSQLLTGVIGQDSAAEFLTAAFNPMTFYEKMTEPENWETVLCDPTQFSMTFTFPDFTNVKAIQKAMCNLARNQSASLEQLVNLFDAGSVLKAYEKLNTGSGYDVGFMLWDLVKNSTLRLLNNFEKLQYVNVNGTVAMEWLTPILSTLQSLQNPSADSNIAMCNQVVHFMRETEMFRQFQPMFMDVFGYVQLATQQVKLAGVFDDVVCALARDNDLNRALDILKSTGFWGALTQTGSLVSSTGSQTLDCTQVVQISSELITVLNSTLMGGGNMADWDKMGQCFQQGNQNFETFFNGLDSVLKITSEMIPLLKDPGIRALLGNEEVVPVLDFILKVFTQQRSVLVQFSDLLKNESSVEMYLQKVLQLSPSLITSLLKSSINLDAIGFLSLPVDEIQATLCNATRLEEILTLPNFTDISIDTLSQGLCTNSSRDTAAAIKSAAEATALVQQIITASQTGLDSAFFNNVSTHIFNLIGDLQSISEIASLFSTGFEFDVLKDNIGAIDRFLMSNGPDKLVQSLTAVMEDIRKLLPPSSEANTIINEINIYIRGFAGLNIVQSYFLESLTVVDFVKNPSEVYQYLVNVVRMSPKDAETILEGVFSIRVFLNSSYILDRDFDCTDIFGQLIVLNRTEPSIRQITRDLCRVNESTAIQISNMLIPQLTIGDLVKRYVSLSADEIFRSSNISAAEATKIAKSLVSAQNNLLDAADILSGKDSTLGDKSKELVNALFNLPQAQTGARSMEGIQPLLCGRRPGDLIGDSFNIGSVLESTGTAGSAAVDVDEVNELSQVDKESGGDFCQQMYRDIKDQSLGAVIWAYLKPIMRGKIVFSPDTPYTRQIIDQANTVFKTMAEVQKVAKIWSQGAPKLVTMSVKAKQMGNVKNALKNEFVSSLLRQTSGLDAKDLLTGLDALDKGNFNSSSIQGMKVAADLVVNYTSCMEMNRFLPAKSESELEKLAFKLAKNNTFLAAIVFTNLPDENNRRKRATGELPKHVQYKIRMETENVRPTSRLKARYWQPAPDDHFATDLQYLRGFMQLQDMVERAIIAVHTHDNTTLPGVYLKQFPFPCHTYDIYIGVLGSYLLPVVMTFAWLAALAIATKNLVYDREEGQEEALRLMGMKAFLNWFAWLVITLVIMVLVSVVLMIVLKFSKLFNMSDPSIIFLYLICFCFSTTMLCYFVSAFFTRVTLAILTVLIVYFLSYLPYVILISMEVSMTFWQKSLACLFSTSAFGFAAQYLARLEMQNIGLQWSNINQSPIASDPMTFSWACYMMLIDSAIYLVLGWYIRTVMPGKFGVSQPWYFPFSPNYWWPQSRFNRRGLESRGRTQNVTVFEPGTSTGIPGMALRDLTKKFGNKTVVDNISADFCEGQVTALLGHNGAAKTTTMNMLIGILEPTSGEVYINKKGNSGGLGYCPQHNTLFDYMTVMEHMQLYAGVKCSWSRAQKNDEIKNLLADVDLFHVRDVRVHQLSGGMKRRLCVALAFVGGSTAVVLDEPTSGVDPSARKHIWNLIIKQRIGRTILLSTHHLDEADTVGDTVAIMHNGHILCCGSSMFLKEKLGGGFHLTIDKAIKHQPDGSYSGNQSDCMGQKVLSFIQRTQPGAQLVEEVGTELVFNLPRATEGRTTFSNFFNELDANLDTLNISSYGVSDTTLEDVFLKATALADSGVPLTEDVLEKERLKLSQTQSTNEAESDTVSEGSSQETSVNMADSSRQRYSGLSLKLQQMSALLAKRFHHYRRNWRMFLSIVLLPLILFLVSMGFAQIRPSEEQQPKLLMTPDLYGPKNSMFLKDSNTWLTLSDKIIKALESKPGIGTACMKGFDPELPVTCSSVNRTYSEFVQATKSGGCACNSERKQICPDGIVPIPRTMETPSGNYLQNLQGIDIPSYLLDSFEQFIEKRYGGWVVENGYQGSDTELATTIWYNNRGYHAMPSFVNAYSNAMLRAKMGETATADPAEYGISLYSHPFTFQTMKLSLNSLGTQATDAGIALVFLLAFTFIPSAFVVFLVNENINKEKQLQFIVGVGSGLYWITSFLWDLLVYTLTVALAVVVLAIFQIGPYWDRLNLAALVSLLMLYGWAILPMMYMTVKLFRSASSAYLTLFCLNMLLGILSIITIFSLILFQSYGMKYVDQVYDVCKYLFLIFPQFCMGQGLIDIAKNHFQYILFIRFGEDTYENPFSLELLGWKLIAMAIQGFVFFIITIIIESRHGSSPQIPRRLLDIHDEDDDVRNERNRIQMGHTKDDIMYINGLTKMYRHGLRKFLAVDNISFGVSKGECFGLLGVNGAGKTTTFKMLTGDTSPSSGEAYLNGQRISQGDPGVGQEMGYCPQEGGLDNYLSGEELLYCHAKLKGMSDEQTKQAVTELVVKLRLVEYIQKPVHTYSGGTKRKLSLAVAMLGEPPVLFLDEPTTGMDPSTRRLVWKCISKAGQNGQSIVLTSHSMDECDALCGRLAIMVNGQLMCLGSSQHLKSKFGDGYTVIMHIQGLSNNRYNIEQAFLTRFPGAKVKVSVDGQDQHQSVLEVHIPRGMTSVAELFSILQAAEEQKHITRYSLSQTTLDTVFVNFARDQSDSVSDQDNASTSGSDNTATMATPFTNQTFAYMNPEYAVDPEDIRFTSQYSANLAQASTNLSSFTGDKGRQSFKDNKGKLPAPGLSSEGGKNNEAFTDEDESVVTRL